MSFSSSRIRRAEVAMRTGGQCSRCKLRPHDKGYIVIDGKDPVPELPEVCPECGRSTRIRIVVVEEEEIAKGEGA